ncbi:MAG: choice-of-anchor D domain-containing protein, partial [Proteobacteria bacterium]|nr:choice-of-anchor D domain-containing protein [Pseudomonadota bacterium]
VHVGDAGHAALTVANNAPTGGFGENLLAVISGTPTGGLTLGSTTATGAIAPGSSGSLTLDYSTALNGVISGQIHVALTSDGGTGPGSIDGLGTSALPAQDVAVNVQVNAYANPEFQADNAIGSIVNGTLDIGAFQHNSDAAIFHLDIVNDVTGPVDLLSGSLSSTGGFLTTGLGSFSGLGAGQHNTAPTFTLETLNNGVVVQTVTLSSRGSNASGFDAALPTETLTLIGTVADLPLPTITVSPTLTSFQRQPTLVGPIAISDPNTVTQAVTVTVSDIVGALAASSAGQASIRQSDSHTLTVIGSLTDVNATLASLTYAADALGSDTITIKVRDQHHAEATQTIAVTDIPVPKTQAILNGPTRMVAVLDRLTSVSGLQLVDPGAMASGETITLSFFSAGATLVARGTSNATVTGNGTEHLVITGTVQEINALLGDDVAYGFLVDALKDGGVIGSQTADILKVETAEGLVTAVGGPTEAKFFEVGVENVTYELLRLLSLIPGNPEPSFAEHIKRLAEIIFGKPEIVLADGSIYNLEAAGEFVLAASKQNGDSFLVEARLQPVEGSSTTSEMTQVAAQVGHGRVTFDIDRASFVYVNGTATTLGLNAPLDLDGGRLTRLSATDYQVTWNTGEVLDILNSGTFLSAEIAGGPNSPDGSIVGLIGNGATASANFVLPSGVTLAAPLSETDLRSFIDAWRVVPSVSILDYEPGQDTTTFTDLNFGKTRLTLADLPASVVANAASVVAATGVADPGAQQAMQLDYITSGGDRAALMVEANLFTGLASTPLTMSRSGPAPLVAGVIARDPIIEATGATTTPVEFDVYLTGTRAVDTVIPYAVVSGGAGYLDGSAFGGAFPSGSATIVAGQTLGHFSINLPANALGTLATENLKIQILAPTGVGLINATAQATIDQPIAGPPPVPVLRELANLGTFWHDGNHYYLNLGTINYGDPLPPIAFAIDNAGTIGVDSLTGTFEVPTMAGFKVTGANVPQPLRAGESYQGLNVALEYTKFGRNEQTITFRPVDTNSTGFSAPLAPITLTVTDTIIPPAKRYSYAYADVHIITYDGTYYDFQAAGEFTLAKSRLPGHSFDIQLRLEPWSRSVGVTYITQAAVAVGSHRVTFDPGRTSVVQIDGAPTTLSLANPLINLPDGTVKVLSENVYRVDWNTGEEATFSINGFMINVADGIPLSLPQAYAGLQGEAAGQANDFQLADGTVLEQPLSTTDLYGRFADAWRVTQSSSLFDYEAGESTATFTDKGFPLNLVSVNDLPTDAVAKAEALVAAAGVTDPNIARGAVLDYLATGDHSFIAAAADVNAQQFITVGPTITPAPTTTPVAGVVAELASVLEATSGATHVVFDAYLTRPNATDTTLFYHVVDGGLGFLGATDFGLTLPAGTVTIAAGQTIGAFTIDVPFDALGTDAAAKLQVSIDAPGSVVPIFAPDAVANIVNNDPHAGAAPVPVLSKLTPFGTLTHVGNAYTLDLGTLSIGEDSPVIQLAVSNDADAPADSLSGVFGVPLGNGFTVIGNHLDAALLPGRSYTGLKVDALTDLAGDHVETMTFSPRAVNESGYIGTMDPITLVIKDTVITPADLRLNTPSTIIYPNVRVGTPVSTALSITNIGAQTGGRPLAVTGDAFGFATVNGGIVSLVPGATDITSIRVGIDTSFVGQLAGIVELDPVSNNPNGTTTPTASTATINEFVSVYRLASGSVAPMTRFVHVGDTGTINAVISNTATADGYSEALIASLDKLTGAFTPLSSGPTGPIAAGGSTAALSFGFNATQVGTIHGDITFDLFSDGGTGSNSIDGLGTMALADLAAPIDVIVNNYATASISSDRLLTKIGEHNYLLNLGTAAIGNGALTAGLTIGNTATGPADLLGGRFSVRGPGVFADTGFGLFGSLAAGDLLQAGTISLSRSTAGLFTQIITLAPTDSNASGYFQQMGGETITVVGSIVAPTGSGNGDVHMTTFSGVKYDFQAVGAFVLERSTAPGNDMEVQIETGGVHGALSLTTKVAARLGPDVVTIAPGRDSLVWLNGEADTALGTANPIQNLAGGQIRQLRPDMVRITWNSGETLTITHPSKFGSIDYLNTSMALGPNNTPGSVEGLLGSFDDPASDIQMPDGTVLLQPVSNAELVGPFAAAWSVTPDTTLLDETTNAMRFLAKPDAGVLCATAAKQVLMPSGGVDTLSDANHVGAVFTGTLSDLAKVLIDSFSKQDAIDVTDLPFAGVLASYSGSADDGLLLLSNGAQTGSLHLSGSLANGTFHVASDQHGGSLITFG